MPLLSWSFSSPLLPLLNPGTLGGGYSDSGVRLSMPSSILALQ